MLGAVFGGVLRGACWILKSAWSHPVLRLVILGLAGVWGLPRIWWPSGLPPGSHLYGVALPVVIGAEIWWLLVADTAHHLSPHPGLMSVLRGGYPILAFPVVEAWSRFPLLLDVAIVGVAGVSMVLVPKFATSQRGQVR